MLVLGRLLRGGKRSSLRVDNRPTSHKLTRVSISGCGPKKWLRGRRIAPLADPEWTSKFRVRRMEWNENRIILTAAGLALHESGPHQAANPNGRRTRPFRTWQSAGL